MGISLREWNTARYYAEIENEAIDRERQAQARERELGLARERALLRNQVVLRFGDAAAERLADLLDRIDDFDRLDEIGRWIVSCEAGDELLSRALRLNGSG